MTKPRSETFLPLLKRAMETEIGIAIAVNEPLLFRKELLAIRREHPEFEELITFLPEGKDEVFLCRRSVELPE